MLVSFNCRINWRIGSANRETYPDGGCSPLVDGVVGCRAILRERRAEARRRPRPRSLASIQRRPSVPSPFDAWPRGASPGGFRDRNSSVSSAENRARNTEKSRPVVVASSRLLRSPQILTNFQRSVVAIDLRIVREDRRSMRMFRANRSIVEHGLLLLALLLFGSTTFYVYEKSEDFCILTISFAKNRSTVICETRDRSRTQPVRIVVKDEVVFLFSYKQKERKNICIYIAISFPHRPCDRGDDF